MMNLEKISVSIEQILLDPNNPRFADVSDDALNIARPRFAEPAIQSAAYEKMSNPKFEINTLAQSIASVGFVPVDNIVVARVDDEHFYVIEGNRRVTAIKYLLKQHELGLSTLSDEEANALKQLDVLVINDSDDEAQLAGMIIQGIRNVSGIKEWDAFQKAQFINEMLEKGKTPGQISKTIGLSVKDVNRYYKAFSVMLQFKTDEEYADQWKPSYFSHFDEILRKPVLRNFFGFNENTMRFDRQDNIKRFYDWIVPDEDGKVAIGDARSIRKLSELVGDPTALAYLESHNLDKALNYINQKNFQQNKITATECIDKIKGAIAAFNDILVEGLEKELADEEFQELEAGISNMLEKYRRVQTLRQNG